MGEVLNSRLNGGKSQDFDLLAGQAEAMRRCLLQLLDKQLSLYTIYRTTVNDELRFDGHFRWKFAREKTTVTVTALSNDDHSTAVEAVFARSNEDLALKDVFAAFNRKETHKA
ncbi:hypothetical protein SI65_07735 [Aspergillus cristatus]|uniref:Uncharacterized protein n=1 Tax=Aspergillus cristatus TaxID=573508 RepID=A0A1E3B724_ASPCR|nr:hypothetical protein SI65_07735 [Aspergillus cristatus]